MRQPNVGQPKDKQPGQVKHRLHLGVLEEVSVPEEVVGGIGHDGDQHEEDHGLHRQNPIFAGEEIQDLPMDHELIL